MPVTTLPGSACASRRLLTVEFKCDAGVPAWFARGAGPAAPAVATAATGPSVGIGATEYVWLLVAHEQSRVALTEVALDRASGRAAPIGVVDTQAAATAHPLRALSVHASDHAEVVPMALDGRAGCREAFIGYRPPTIVVGLAELGTNPEACQARLFRDKARGHRRGSAGAIEVQAIPVETPKHTHFAAADRPWTETRTVVGTLRRVHFRLGGACTTDHGEKGGKSHPSTVPEKLHRKRCAGRWPRHAPESPNRGAPRSVARRCQGQTCRERGSCHEAQQHWWQGGMTQKIHGQDFGGVLGTWSRVAGIATNGPA